jgi:hypothetical protein
VPKPRDVASAAPDLAISAAALLCWIDPHILGVERAGWLSLAVFVEFPTAAAAWVLGRRVAVEGPWPRRIARAMWFALPVSLILFLFSRRALVAFWILMLNRLSPLLLGEASAAQQRAMLNRGMALSFGYFYGTMVLATIFHSVLPLGGFSDGTEIPQVGNNPHIFMFFAVVYFGMWGATELFISRWLAGRET